MEVFGFCIVVLSLEINRQSFSSVLIQASRFKATKGNCAASANPRHFSVALGSNVAEVKFSDKALLTALDHLV